MNQSEALAKSWLIAVDSKRHFCFFSFHSKGSRYLVRKTVWILDSGRAACSRVQMEYQDENEMTVDILTFSHRLDCKWIRVFTPDASSSGSLPRGMMPLSGSGSGSGSG